jgi:hypothetical protein
LNLEERMTESTAAESLKRIASGTGLIPFIKQLGMQYVAGGERFVKLKKVSA